MAKNPAGYKPPEFKNEITLQLSRNESQSAIDNLDEQLGSLGAEFVSRYPNHVALQNLIGKWVGVDVDRIVVTAGGDDSIDRVMRTSLTKERTSVVTHAPSFEMIDIYCGNYNGKVNVVQWIDGEFPADDLIAKIDSATALVVITSPNNPTGGLVDLKTCLLYTSDAADE